ncbi:MAG: stage II sporulation protein M [Syntrophomonadaceae bacterium]|nr:stage II sporulation protein M [Syntrophomonadaceae bacterium]
MKVKSVIKQHIKENKWHYLILIIFFSLGIFLGYHKIFTLSGEVKEHLLSLVNTYMLGGFKGELSSGHIFSSAYIQQLKTIFIIWFLGLTVIGIPFIIGVVFFRGFSLGFTLGFLVKEKATTGIIISIFSILPQNLIYIPLIMLISIIAINFSIYIVSGYNTGAIPLSKGLMKYLLLLIIFLILVLSGVLIETYLVPFLLALFLN